MHGACMDGINKVLLATILVLAVSASLIVYLDDESVEPTTYSVTYELDGGENNALNPDTYVEGTSSLQLYSPVKDGFVFSGWYLNPGLTIPFENDLPTGDITLYASWNDSLEGKGYVLSFSGNVMNGPFQRYTMTGTYSMTYLYYNPDSDSYYLDNTVTTSYDYGYYVDTRTTQNNRWSGSDSSVEWEFLGNETITTIAGGKDCEVWKATYLGGYEVQWIGDGWIPYRIESISQDIFASRTVVYEFAREFTVEVDNDISVEAYCDAGVTVDGQGDYHPGDVVTLVASSEEHGFLGWFDANGNLVSYSESLTITVGGSDLVLFALNDCDEDIAGRSGTVTILDSGLSIDSATWRIVDSTGRTMATVSGDPAEFVFDEAGAYTVTITGEVDGEPYLGYRDVFVNGTMLRTFEWEHEGSRYSYDLRVDYDDYAYYKNLYSVDMRCQDVLTHERDRTFVTYQDKYVRELASMLSEISAQKGLDQLSTANLVLDFVQSMEYQSDEVFMGHVEYWKFPLETLCDQGGDCEDTAILYSSLMKAMGFDTVLIIVPGHMASGILLSGETTYRYCETTSNQFEVGVKPSTVDLTNRYIVTIP